MYLYRYIKLSKTWHLFSIELMEWTFVFTAMDRRKSMLWLNWATTCYIVISFSFIFIAPGSLRDPFWVGILYWIFPSCCYFTS